MSYPSIKSITNEMEANFRTLPGVLSVLVLFLLVLFLFAMMFFKLFSNKKVDGVPVFQKIDGQPYFAVSNSSYT